MTEDCVEDDTAPGGDCGGSATGLNDVRSVAVSPDDEHVYAVGYGESAIQILDRDTANGQLTPLGCVEDDGVPVVGCADDEPALAQVRSIVLSPNGASLYATTEGDDSVVRFSRNSSTGALTWQGCHSDDGGGGDAACTATDGLANAYAAAVSPNGQSLYAVSNSDNAIKRFDRSTTTGALTPQGCVDDVGSSACPHPSKATTRRSGSPSARMAALSMPPPTNPTRSRFSAAPRPPGA